MKLKSTYLFLLYSILFSSVYAQKDEFILCRVIDSETKESIPFVTVVIPEKGLGVIANAEGDFRILSSSVAESDSVIAMSILL